MDKLYDSGDLRELVKAGIVSLEILEQRKIYHAFYAHIEKNQVGKVQAAKDVGKVFGVSSRHVYSILKKFNS